MRNTVPTDVQAEIRQKLEEGKINGETEVQVLSRMVWSERQINKVLLATLEEILRARTSALYGNAPAPKKADILQMKPTAITLPSST